MGKVVGKIFEFGSLAALAVVTGGAAAALAAGETFASAVAFGVGTLSTITGVGAGAAAGLAVGGLSTLASLVGKPSLPSPHGQDTAVKSPTPARQRAYGRAGLVGAYVFYQTDPVSGVAADIHAIHDNWWAPIDGVEGFYLGDDRVANDRGVLAGLPDGTYTDGKVEIDYRPGGRVNSVFTQVANLFPSWDAKHRGDGVTTGMVTWQPVKSANYTKYYAKGQPSLRMIARWSTVYDWRDGDQSVTDPLTWKWSENPVLHYVHYELITDGRQPASRMVIDGVVNQAWVSELAGVLQEKWDRLFAPTLAYWTAAANDCDTTIPITFYRVASSGDAKAGDASIAVPNTNGLAVGMAVTITALDNVNHTETMTVVGVSADTIGLGAKLGYDHPQGSEVRWEATSNHPLFEPRYRGCVAHQLTDAHKDTKAAIIGCFDGWVAPQPNGALICYSGRYYAPTVTIGPDEIVSHSVDDGVDDEDATNELVLTYISAEHNYQPVDCTPWSDDDDIASRGRIASQPLQNQVPSFTQARRLAKRALAHAMAPYRGAVTTNAAGRKAVGQRFITLDVIEGSVSFYSGPAEITGLTYNLQTGGVTFQWVAADPNVDAWNPATEEGQPAPIGNVVSAASLAAPAISEIDQDTGSTSSDGTTARVLVVATGMNRSDVSWYARWRVQGAAIWAEVITLDVDPSDAVSLSVGPVPTGKTIEVEVCYQVGDGRLSDYSATATFTVAANGTIASASDLSMAATTIQQQQLTIEQQTADINNLAKRVAKLDGGGDTP